MYRCYQYWFCNERRKNIYILYRINIGMKYIFMNSELKLLMLLIREEITCSMCGLYKIVNKLKRLRISAFTWRTILECFHCMYLQFLSKWMKLKNVSNLGEISTCIFPRSSCLHFHRWEISNKCKCKWKPTAVIGNRLSRSHFFVMNIDISLILVFSPRHSWKLYEQKDLALYLKKKS